MATAPVGSARSVSEMDGLVELQDAESVETLVRLVPRTRLFILSPHDDVIDLVREAAQSDARVACARDLDHMLQSLSGGDPDVLIIDGAHTNITATIERLAPHFPDAVTIVIGTREESTELLQMVATGRIFRFLLRPLSSGPVRLALGAAIARHAERKESNRSSASAPATNNPPKSKLLTFGALAAALLVLLGCVWAAASLLTAKPVAQEAIPVSTLPEAKPAPTPAPDASQTQLALAAQAMAEGRVTEAGGALELYRQVLALDSGNAAATAGIRLIADQLLAQAEQSLLAENADDAQQAIALVRDIDADHPRLSFLETQLAREGERLNLREVRLRRLLGVARDGMQTGNLLGMVSGGAVEAMLEARQLEPRDPEVVRGIRELTAALTDAVRKASSTGDTQRARAYATAAVRIGVSSQVLSTMERALAESRQRENSQTGERASGAGQATPE